MAADLERSIGAARARERVTGGAGGRIAVVARPAPLAVARLAYDAGSSVEPERGAAALLAQIILRPQGRRDARAALRLAELGAELDVQVTSNALFGSLATPPGLMTAALRQLPGLLAVRIDSTAVEAARCQVSLERARRLAHAETRIRLRLARDPARLALADEELPWSQEPTAGVDAVRALRDRLREGPMAAALVGSVGEAAEAIGMRTRQASPLCGGLVPAPIISARASSTEPTTVVVASATARDRVTAAVAAGAVHHALRRLRVDAGVYATRSEARERTIFACATFPGASLQGAVESVRECLRRSARLSADELHDAVAHALARRRVLWQRSEFVAAELLDALLGGIDPRVVAAEDERLVEIGRTGSFMALPDTAWTVGGEGPGAASDG